MEFSGRKVMVTKRIMECGDSEAVSWMLENFSKEDMKEVLAGSRGLTKKSANYWAVFLEADETPLLLKQADWEDVKKFFIAEAGKLM